MDMQTLTLFFMWCTIINGGILTLWSIFFMFSPDLIYRLQSRWFPVPRETFSAIFYLLIGLFKIFFLTFNLVPYLALLMMG
ncbi:MAG TPA: hypothetical protein EYG68_05595 [Leucothrix mucor]|nr:hypothetical protein [Leucothrix mucor]